MAKSLLQCNLNHCRAAQDLLAASLPQLQIDVAIVAEPYRFPANDSRWTGDLDGVVAVVASSGRRSSPLAVRARGHGFVVANWGDHIVVVGCYVSPRTSLPDFEEFIARVGISLERHRRSRTLVLGDFNAKSRS